MSNKTAPFALLKLDLTVISRHGFTSDSGRGSQTLSEARDVAMATAEARNEPVLLVWTGWERGPEYVDPEGNVSKLYNHNGLLGCVDQWTARDTKTLVGLYNGVQSGMETAEATWVVVCEKHHTLVGHATLTEARRTRSPVEFCDDCRDALK